MKMPLDIEFYPLITVYRDNTGPVGKFCQIDLKLIET